MAVGRRPQFLTTLASQQDGLSVLTTWWPAFPKMGAPRGRGRSHNASYRLVSKITHCCLCLLFTCSKSRRPAHTRGERVSSTWRPQRVFGCKTTTVTFSWVLFTLKKTPRSLSLTAHNTAGVGRGTVQGREADPNPQKTFQLGNSSSVRSLEWACLKTGVPVTACPA